MRKHIVVNVETLDVLGLYVSSSCVVGQADKQFYKLVESLKQSDRLSVDRTDQLSISRNDDVTTGTC